MEQVTKKTNYLNFSSRVFCDVSSSFPVRWWLIHTLLMIWLFTNIAYLQSTALFSD